MILPEPETNSALLAAGARVGATDSFGWNAMHWAAVGGATVSAHTDCPDILIIIACCTYFSNHNPLLLFPLLLALLLTLLVSFLTSLFLPTPLLTLISLFLPFTHTQACTPPSIS